MINPWEWQEYYLLLSLRNRAGGNIPYLLNRVSQAEFMERYIEEWNQKENGRYTMPHEITVTPLTEEVYNMIEPMYKDNQKMEG